MRPSTQLWDDALQRSQQAQIEVYLTKTGAASVAPLFPNSAVQCGMGANLDYASVAICLANVNAMLGVSPATSTAEVDAATFFAAAPMGIDALGFVVSFSGEVRAVNFLEACLMPVTSAAATVVGVAPAALSATLATNGFVTTASGNVVGRIVLTGLDAAATNSVIRLTISFQPK